MTEWGGNLTHLLRQRSDQHPLGTIGDAMTKYGQFCPIAKALEFVGDRWTLLIIRDMLMGTSRFNDLERGLPRISRTLLASRLRQLQRAGLVEKRPGGEVASQAPREYHLTQAGRELFNVIDSDSQAVLDEF